MTKATENRPHIASQVPPHRAVQLVRVCIDEDCPNCGWPERWADLNATDGPDAPTVFGCNKCKHRGLTRTS